MFTNDQIEMLSALEKGVVWVGFQSEREDQILHFLMDYGYCTPREDITPDWIELTEKGRAALADFRQEKAEAAKHERDKQRADTKRLEERRQDHADEERRHRTQNKIAIIVPLLIFVLGILIEHLDVIRRFLSSLFH